VKKLTIGVLAPDNATSESLNVGIEVTGLAAVTVQGNEYFFSKSDWLARRFVEANPDIVILEVCEQAPALRCLKLLYSVLPNTYFLVASASTDPQLIIEAMRSGAREFIPLPATGASLLQAFNRHIAEAAQRTGADSIKRGRLYSVVSPKPGSGATTLAVNLAGITAANSNSKVALLDMNRPVGDISAYLNLKPTFTIAETIAAVHRLDPVLLESYMTPSNGFSVLSGFRDYSSTRRIGPEALSQILDVSVHTFAHTFVDLSEHLADDEAQVLANMSDAILVVLTPDIPSIWRTECFLNSMAKLNAKINIILNRKTRNDQISLADIERLLHHSIYFTLPNDYGASMKSLNSGRLLDLKESKHLGRAYSELATQLAGLPTADTRRGLLGLLLKPSSAGGPTHA